MDKYGVHITNTILSLSKVKFAMYGSSVFQNLCLGRQQVYLITYCSDSDVQNFYNYLECILVM